MERQLKRTTIWLTEPQVKAITRLAKQKGLKAADVTRRLIDAGLAQEQK